MRTLSFNQPAVQFGMDKMCCQKRAAGISFDCCGPIPEKEIVPDLELLAKHNEQLQARGLPPRTAAEVWPWIYGPDATVKPEDILSRKPADAAPPPEAKGWKAKLKSVWSNTKEWFRQFALTFWLDLRKLFGKLTGKQA